MNACPCSNEKSYAECCQPYHDKEQKPPTAEKLMRSRYSAFAKGLTTYIRNTFHPDHRGDVNMDEIKAWSDRADWTGLEIVRTEAGGPDDEHGVVEFIAHYKEGKATQHYHEIGTFKKEGEQWYFVDGTRPKQKPVVREAAKVGRNDPCSCGSGKKFKKCCGKKR